MKKIIWKPNDGMEASGPWCEGTAVIDGKSYICDVDTVSNWDRPDRVPFGYGHALFVCAPSGPQYRRGRVGWDDLLLIVDDDWTPDLLPGYIDILIRHIG